MCFTHNGNTSHLIASLFPNKKVMDTQEIEIPVPWGKITGKTWGSASANPLVLLLHGLMDNAGTFDYLVPLLPTRYYYVSIDLPGHGFSSHISPGQTLQMIDYVYVTKLITEYFDRDKYIIIGHSLGAMLGIHFGLFYPEKLSAVFLLDALWCEIIEPDEYLKWIRNKYDEIAKANILIRRKLDFQVSYEKALEIMTSWRFDNSDLTHEATQALLKRSLIKCANGKFRFTRDLRLRHYVSYPTSARYVAEVLTSSEISFKVVCILSRHHDDVYKTQFPALAESFQKIGTWFVVDGNHHFHLNTPEIVAPIINEFLK